MTNHLPENHDFTDIRDQGWIRRLPRWAQPYALLARLDRPIGSWLLFLPGLWSILLARCGVWFSLWLIILFAIGSVVMRGAGCVINDLWDRELDRSVTRTAGRPLAAGAVSVPAALAFLGLLLLIGLLILLQLNRPAQVVGFVSLVLVVLYPVAKRITWWPQIILGFTFGWGVPLGFVAATGSFTPAAFTLYAASIFWILGYDTIYAHQDREDDAMVGIKSTALLLGRQTRPFLALCYALTLALLLLAAALSRLGSLTFVALSLPAILLFWQVIRLDIDNPERCLGLFKLNRAVGLLIGFAILLGR